MNTLNPVVNLEQLIRDARLQRSAAIGRAILAGADAIGMWLKSTFGSSKGTRRASASPGTNHS